MSCKDCLKQGKCVQCKLCECGWVFEDGAYKVCPDCFDETKQCTSFMCLWDVEDFDRKYFTHEFQRQFLNTNSLTIDLDPKVRNFLIRAGLHNYIENFKKDCITYNDLQHLEDEDLWELLGESKIEMGKFKDRLNHVPRIDFYNEIELPNEGENIEPEKLEESSEYSYEYYYETVSNESENIEPVSNEIGGEKLEKNEESNDESNNSCPGLLSYENLHPSTESSDSSSYSYEYESSDSSSYSYEYESSDSSSYSYEYETTESSSYSISPPFKSPYILKNVESKYIYEVKDENQNNIPSLKTVEMKYIYSYEP